MLVVQFDGHIVLGLAFVGFYSCVLLLPQWVSPGTDVISDSRSIIWYKIINNKEITVTMHVGKFALPCILTRVRIC